ncbi:hypothetical protein ABPG74_007581 [Tetrahymena malaccensis]
MNKYTLRFRSDQLEEKFKKEVSQSNCLIFMKVIKLYLFLITLPNLIIIFSLQNYQYLIGQIAQVIFQLVTLFLVSNYRRYVNLWITLLNLAISFYMVIQIRTKGVNIGIDDKGMEFYYGAIGYILHITTSFLTSNLIMTFSQTIISFILYFWVLWSPQYSIIKYTFVAIQIFLLTAYYENQKNFRQMFLLRDGERQWMQIIKKGLLQNIITVSYNIKNNEIKLDLINQQAKKQFNITNSEQFTAFSRKVHIFDQVSDYQECSKLLDKKNNEGNRLFSQQKNTLENKIINLIKQYMHLKKDKASAKILNQQSKVQQNNYKRAKNRDRSDSFSQDQDKQTSNLLYGVYKTTEEDSQQIISIKVTVYRFKTQFFCCLVLSEKTKKLKIKSLEEMNVGLQNNLFQLCKLTGEKFQSILANVQNQKFVKAVISQGLNQIYNYRDHANILKNQFIMKFQNLSISQISLDKFQQCISQRYFDKDGEIDLKFQFKNCNSQNQINTYVEYFYQVIMNLVDNSIKYQNNNSNSNSTPRRSFYLQNSLFHAFEKSDSKQRKNKSIQKQVLSKKIDESKNNNFILQRSKQDESQIQKSFFSIKEIFVILELIKGDNEQSDIFKISVIDQGKGMSMEDLIYILELVGIQNPAYKPDYQSFNFLGWKNNLQIIGKLGPFHNFYIKSNINQGLEYHFYIYQNLEILSNSDSKEFKQFKNSSFDKSIIESNNEYFHINNLGGLKDKKNLFNTFSKNLFKSNISLTFSNVNIAYQQQVQNNIVAAVSSCNKQDDQNSTVSISSEKFITSNICFQKLNTKFIESFSPCNRYSNQKFKNQN